MDDQKKNFNITVLGLGHAGVKILSEFISMIKHPPAQLAIYGIDSDKNSLESIEKNIRIPAAFEWTNGFGCGGDAAKGERTVSKIRNVIAEKIIHSSLIIVCAGMGGGTGTGGCPVIARLAKHHKIPSIFLLTIPFSFEGYRNRKLADKGIEELVHIADVVIPIANDLIFSSLSPDTPSQIAFNKVNYEIARIIKGFCDVFLCKSLISLELSSFKNMLHKKKALCAVGIGVVSDKNEEHKYLTVLEKLLESALLGGEKYLNSSDVIFVMLTGDENLPISEVKQTIEAFKRIVRDDIPLQVGVNCDPHYNGAIQITVLAVKYEHINELPEDFSVSRREEKKKNKLKINSTTHNNEHQELPLVEISRGVFSKLSKTLYKGNDLDIPTFQRKNILIDKGY